MYFDGIRTPDLTSTGVMVPSPFQPLYGGTKHGRNMLDEGIELK